MGLRDLEISCANTLGYLTEGKNKLKKNINTSSLSN
jgi:hypothetical protein